MWVVVFILTKYFGPFRVLHRKGNAYTIVFSSGMRTHLRFYVGKIHPYYQHASSFEDEKRIKA